MDLLPQSVKNFVDSIFAAPLSFLQLIRDMINNAGTVAGRGIDLNNYFGFFAYLPPPLQLVVQSALASIVLLAILFLARAGWDMYLKVKASAKWW